MKKAKIKLVDLIIVSNRTYGGEGDINILAEDIKQNGVINDVTVKPSATSGKYDVVAGRRRVAAMLLLKWEEAPCAILETEEEISKAEAIAGSENINRMAMHPLDEAAIFQKLLENGSTIEELAERYDRKKSEIWQRIQLLGLTDNVKTLFRKGHLSLKAAAMLKSINEKGQEAFFKEFKNGWAVKRGEEISTNEVRRFITNIYQSKLYTFLRDKQCAECKTRTFFTDKNLFDEMDDESETCFNHECYMKKWHDVLSGRISNVKDGHKKTHEAATLICTEDYNEKLIKIFGNKVSFGDVNFSLKKMEYFQRTNANDKEAIPCFMVEITHNGKLEIKPGYWRAKAASGSGSSADYVPSSTKKKELAPIVKLLNLPAEEEARALNAMTESRRITTYGLKQNVLDNAFDKIIAVKAQEFNSLETTESGAKISFLKKYFQTIKYKKRDKEIFDAFVGKRSFEELAQMPEEKIFSLLCALEYSAYELPDLKEFDKNEKNDALNWIGSAKGKLKEIYQEEIRKRIPKQKQEPKKSTEKPCAKKKPLPSAKKIKEVQAKKGDTEKKVKKVGSGKRGMIKT
jgi:ParB/RepB/Spo0J family partition protein